MEIYGYLALVALCFLHPILGALAAAARHTNSTERQLDK